MAQDLESLKEVLGRVRDEVARVIIGQRDVVDLALVAIFTRQHALVEGVPGIAKTLLVRTLSAFLPPTRNITSLPRCSSSVRVSVHSSMRSPLTP